MFYRYILVIVLALMNLKPFAQSASEKELFSLSGGAGFSTNRVQYEYFYMNNKKFELPVHEGFSNNLLHLGIMKSFALNQRLKISPEAQIVMVPNNYNRLKDTVLQRHFAYLNLRVNLVYRIKENNQLLHSTYAGAGNSFFLNSYNVMTERNGYHFFIGYNVFLKDYNVGIGIAFEQMRSTVDYIGVDDAGNTHDFSFNRKRDLIQVRCYYRINRKHS